MVLTVRTLDVPALLHLGQIPFQQLQLIHQLPVFFCVQDQQLPLLQIRIQQLNVVMLLPLLCW